MRNRAGPCTASGEVAPQLITGESGVINRRTAMAFQPSMKWDEKWQEFLDPACVKSTVILDVRNPEEKEAKNLDDMATQHGFKSVFFPCKMGDDADAAMAKAVSDDLIPADKATQILVFCAVGGRSGRAADALRNMGYEHVRNGGGIDEVKKELAAKLG